MHLVRLSRLTRVFFVSQTPVPATKKARREVPQKETPRLAQVMVAALGR
jgi:Na+-transporting methylmalonyl-CoA/oxaloacetate decarboxylase gamma subunit